VKINVNICLPSLTVNNDRKNSTNNIPYDKSETYRSRDSAIGIATGYGLDDRGVGVRVPLGSRIFSSPRRPDLENSRS
jgi:hypothetical protein